MRINFFILLLVTLTISCSKKEKNKVNYTQEIIDEVRITHNKNKAKKDSLNTFIKLKEVFSLEIDSLVSDSTRFIKKIGYIDLDSEGNIYITDKDYCKIHKYNIEGNFIKSFGNKGRGPGEFISAGALNICNDTLLLSAKRIKKVIKFTVNGEFIENKSYENKDNFPSYPSKIGIVFINLVYKTSSNGEINKNTNIVSLYDNKLNFVKKIFDVVFETNRTKRYDPFANGIFTAYSKDEIYLYKNSKDNYKIEVLDYSSKKIREIRRDYIKKRNTIEEIEELKIQGEKFKLKWYSKFKNSISSLKFDKYNRLWVGCSSNEKFYYDLYEKDILIGKVKMDIASDSYEDHWYFKSDKIIVINRIKNYIKIFDY